MTPDPDNGRTAADPNTHQATPQAARPGLGALFAPRTVAVVGASLSPEKAGNALVRTMATLGPERLWPVNPRGGAIGAIPVHTGLEDLPGVPDLAVLAVPPAATPAALASCGRLGVPAAVVCAGGFAEAGPAGAELQRQVAEVTATYGIRLLGPNTSGFVNPVDGVNATFLPAAAELAAGPVAVVAASGGINLALSFMLAEAGTGVRLGVGLGNAVDVGVVEVLRHLAGDPATRAVALHLEGVADGRGLYEAVAALTPATPVAAFVVGRADVGEFSRSHTGGLTGAYDVTRAALAQAGAVVVDTPTQLVDTVRALAARRARPRPDPGLAVVTGQAGPGLVLADTLQSAGARLPELSAPTRKVVAEVLPPITFQRNPVDTGRPGPGMPRLLGAVAADPAVDAMVVYALEEPDVLPPAEAVAPAVEQGVPVLYASGGPADALDARARELGRLGVPLYRSPDAAATAALGLAADARAAHRRKTASTRPQNPDRTAATRAVLDRADADASAEASIGTTARTGAEAAAEATAGTDAGASARSLAATGAGTTAGMTPRTDAQAAAAGTDAETNTRTDAETTTTANAKPPAATDTGTTAGTTAGTGAEAAAGAGVGNDAQAAARTGPMASARAAAGTDSGAGAGAGAGAGTGAGDLDEAQAKALLAAAGLRVPAHRVCADRAAAHAALRALRSPVVVKVLDAAVTHKTDVGGVHVGVATPQQLDAALDAIDQIPPIGRPRRYLVEEQAPAGVELIVGGITDAAFGPLVLLAPGGVAVDLAASVARRLVPLTAGDALEMVAELPPALLGGFRGLPPVNTDALVEVLLSVSDLLAAHPDITELDVNPLRATEQGLLALDALILRAGTSTTPA